MTYSSEEQSAMETVELPAWAKWMRALVMILLVVSIVAMITMAWAVVRLLGSFSEDGGAQNLGTNWQEQILLPEGAEPISMTQLTTGQYIVVYEIENTFEAQLYSADGEAQAEAIFE